MVATDEALKKVHCLYLIGYLATLVLGSIQFGTFLHLKAGYDISIYGSCIPIFAKMYDWNEDDKGKCAG